MAIRSKIWDAMKPEQQAKFQAAADKAYRTRTPRGSTRRKRRHSSTSRRKARRSTTPDQNAFRTFAQKTLRREIRQRLAEGRARADQRGQVAARRSTTTELAGSDNLSRLRILQVQRAGERSMMHSQLTGSGAGSGGAPRTLRSRCCCVMFATLHHPDFRALRTQQSGRLDGRGHHHDLALDCAVGRGIRSSRIRRNPLRHRLFAGFRAHTPRLHGPHRHRGRRPLRHLAAGRLQLRQLHEGRALGLSRVSDQLALLRLRHLQCRVHLSLLLADLPRDPGREAAGDRSSPASANDDAVRPFALCIVAIVAARRRSACRSAIR